MNKRKFVVAMSVTLVVVLGILTVFVFKARGSSGRELVSGCVPYNVSISKGEEFQAVVEWYTVDECLGYVMYGDNRVNLDFISINREELSSRNHRVLIENLLPSQNYFFLINSGGKSYGTKGIPLSFSLSSL